MLDQPQVQVGFSAPGELAQHRSLTNALHDRQIHAVVPARHGLGVRNLAVRVDPHEPAVNRDVFEEPLVLTWQCQQHLRLRPQDQQLRRRQELHRILLPDPLLQLGQGADRHGRVQLDDHRIDVHLAALARHGHAMVAILDEVRLAQAVQLHRR